MIGKLKDITFARSGEQIISFATTMDYTEEFDALKDYDVDVEIRKHTYRPYTPPAAVPIAAKMRWTD